MNRRPKIVVVGSINMDLVVRCPSLVLPGQTILADSSSEVCGGKGANQAVAAAKAGGQVSMIGRIGNDAFADRLMTNLKQHQIDCTAVKRCADGGSGLAIVAVESSGENSIMVIPGANAQVSAEDVREHRSLIESADVLLVQLEIPLDAVITSIRIAKSAGVKVMLDPAPTLTQWPAELLEVDLICPNETEAAVLVNHPVDTIKDAEKAAITLHKNGANRIAMTLGERGTLFFDGTNFQQIAPFAITAVDSTAAGDAFAGALSVRWAQTGDLLQAIDFGNAAGAIAASREGAQPSLGSREEIEHLMEI